MAVTYYTIAENDQDMNHLANGVFDNEVQSELGPDGLPILNTAAYGCTSGCFTDTPLPEDLTASGEITWWSPSLNDGGSGGVSDVVETGTGIVTLPYSNLNFYPPNGIGSNDGSGFRRRFPLRWMFPRRNRSASTSAPTTSPSFIWTEASFATSAVCMATPRAIAPPAHSPRATTRSNCFMPTSINQASR